MIAAHDVGRIAGRTRYAHAFRRYPSAVEEPRAFLEAVGQIVERDGVDILLPLDEGVLKQLSAEWTGPATLAGPTALQYQALCDKNTLAAVAGSVGIATPRGVVATAGDGPELPRLPNVVKRRISGAPVPGLGTVIVRTEAERAEAIGAFVAATGEAFVQELAEGPCWRVLFAFDGETLAGVTVLTRRKFPRGTGMSSVSEVAQAPHLLEQTERLLSAVAYRGPGELEFIERGRAFLLHDVNLRLPAAVGVAIKAGFDMPRLGVEAGLARRIEPPRTHSAQYVWLHGEVRALLASHRAGAHGEPTAAIVRDILLAALFPRRALDPVDFTDLLRSAAGTVALVRTLRMAARYREHSSTIRTMG